MGLPYWFIMSACLDGRYFRNASLTLENSDTPLRVIIDYYSVRVVSIPDPLDRPDYHGKRRIHTLEFVLWLVGITAFIHQKTAYMSTSITSLSRSSGPHAVPQSIGSSTATTAILFISQIPLEQYLLNPHSRVLVPFSSSEFPRSSWITQTYSLQDANLTNPLLFLELSISIFWHNIILPMIVDSCYIYK